MAYGARLPECSTASCKQAVHDIETLIDYSVEPCKDFYRHVCHRWEGSRGIGVDRDSASFLRSGVERFLRYANTSLKSVGREKPASTDFLYAAKFYSSCERFLSSPNVSLSEVLLSSREYGEEVLRRSSFTSVGRYIIELSLARGITTVLDVRLSRFPDGVFLRILRGQTLSQKLGVEQALPLQEYLEEVLSESSIIHGREFNLTYVLEIEHRLQNYMVGEIHEQRQGAAVLQHLSTVIRSWEWLDALNSHLADTHQLSSQSVISIGNIGVIRKLMYFFRELVDYGVVYLYVQVLFDALRFDYLRRLNTSDTERVVLSCLQATRLAMRKATTAIFSELFSEQSTDVVISRIFQHVREVVADGSAFTWMSEFRREEARRRLQDVGVHQFRIWSLNEEPHAYNLTEASVGSKFPSLFIGLKKLQQQSLLEDPSAVHQANIDDVFLRGTEVFYDKVSNTVIIPAFMRREPIVYVDDVPPEFTMGTLGVLLTRALLQTALPQITGGTWAYFEKTSLHRFEHCVDTWAASALNLTLRYARDDNHPEFYVWSHSTRSAYEALRETYHRSVTISNWKNQWQSALETFFRRFCLLSCRVRNEQQPASSIFCFLPQLNMKEFSKVFGCQYSPSLYTQHYCVL
ncbi:phosphate-regulating neutral endopeptidase PHEX-like [Dermacentor variabilis]|uniref:phosphate-regulating neutral endopeptidase PHEX-like n=1 Tax=Dermacentor variabilis TaxID=34621 RepID=UPI003F5AE60C